jgi:hypothetical protein
MRGTHYDTPFICQNRVEGIISVEGVSPHGRPEVIATQPQQQFKYLFIYMMVEATELFFCPTGKGGCFIVNKDAAIFYRWGMIVVSAFFDKYGCFLFDRYIGPPVPGRYAELFR